MASNGDLSTLEHRLSISLGQYSVSVAEALDAAAKEAMARLVRSTKALAPVGRRLTKRKFDEGRPHLVESISSMRQKTAFGVSTFVWYVKAPNNRFAHIVERGHNPGSKQNSYVEGAHFLQKSLEEEVPRYENAVREVIVNGG